VHLFPPRPLTRGDPVVSTYMHIKESLPGKVGNCLVGVCLCHNALWPPQAMLLSFITTMTNKLTKVLRHGVNKN
jgi:hypothetical protein